MYKSCFSSSNPLLVEKDLPRVLTLLSWSTLLALTTLTTLTTSTESWLGAGREINSQGAVVNGLALELLHSLLSGSDIGEVGVGETSWLTGAAVNGNTDVDNVLDVAEELVQVGIGHLESEVADEEGLGWGVLGTVLGGVGHIVDDHAAAGEDSVVKGLDSLGGGLNVLEGNVSETLAQSASILCDPGGLDLSVWRESLLKLLWGGLEEEVSDVNGAGWLSLVSWWGGEAALSWGWGIVPGGSFVLDSLFGLRGELLHLLGGLLNLLLGLLDNALWLIFGRVEALECGDNGGLVADGEWSGGWGGGADNGGRWGSKCAESGSLNEVHDEEVWWVSV